MKSNAGEEDTVEDTQGQRFVFSELLQLTEYTDGAREWKELVRWVKFEETVEEAGNRWSKPHVTTPSMHGVIQLRRFLKTGILLLDLEGNSLVAVCRTVAEELVKAGAVSREVASSLTDLLLLKHRHQFEGPRQLKNGIAATIKNILVSKMENKKAAGDPLSTQENSPFKPVEKNHSTANMNDKRDLEKQQKDGKVNKPFVKKLPGNAEAAVILVGSLPYLDRPVSVFVRLEKPAVLGDLPEVDIPTRFLYFLLGSSKDPVDPVMTDIARSLGSALSDKYFSQAIYEVNSREEVLDAFDEYLDAIKTLPRDWNTTHYIEPPGGHNEKEEELREEEADILDDNRRNREASGLVRSGRLFGGLVDDLKRKAPHYLSDFTDGFNPQCISSFMFLYFACLAPIVAFGGLLGEATEQRIATIEGLVAGLLSGVIFALFSGQPLNLLGSTGPVYVFEKILYEMCKAQEWDYLSLRLWIGIWVGVMLLLLVMFDASAYVCYITRFTEELFASLVAFIFIMSAIQNTMGIKKDVKSLPCNCISSDPFFSGFEDENLTRPEDSPFWNLNKTECIRNDGILYGPGCEHGFDVFLMSVILFLGAFSISIGLKQFRSSAFFPSWVRNFLSDFAVIIGILSMTGLDYFTALPTPKLTVPSEFKPTWEGRDWLVSHALVFPEHALANPWWVDGILAPIFAILATILIFMDQQITAVIVNRKEYKLKKGCGYHLDLLVLAVIVVISSVFGLPWFIANTIPSIVHMQSLAKESTTTIPGEKPQFLGIREQRLTGLLIALLTGLSVFMTPILRLLPMPVLYGVFLYMGISSLRGLQFFDRLLLVLMPQKFQPNYVYLKYVRIHRVHLYTAVQMMSLIALWMVKSFPSTSIAFPVMLVVMCVIRKVIEAVFNSQELLALDDLLPEAGGKKKRNLGYVLTQTKEEKDFSLDSELEDKGLEVKGLEDSHVRDSCLRQRQKNHHIFEDELEELIMNNNKSSQKSRLVSSTAQRPQTRAQEIGLNTSMPEKRLTIFLKLEEDDIYTPVHLSPVNMQQLHAALKTKFHKLENVKISSIIERSVRGLSYPLDDSMLELLTHHQVFHLALVTDEDGGVTVTMTEQKLDMNGSAS